SARPEAGRRALKAPDLARARLFGGRVIIDVSPRMPTTRAVKALLVAMVLAGWAARTSAASQPPNVREHVEVSRS
ncbi:MAG TPA: hypothetical protein VLV76_14340, partial [Candidatus Acidoferrum sp.]|nr:hypothetical protein [Candidatus Acidoferrum sp.]